MKKHIIKFAVLFMVFVLSVIIISAVTNKGNTDMTAEIASATYPTITTMVEGMEVNTLHGYSNEMDAKFMRDTITPLKEDRKLTIYVKDGDLEIEEISYQVRSLDTQRLVEDNKVANFTRNENQIQAEIPVKDLIDEETEYILTIVLHCGKNQNIYYYTRIILAKNQHVKAQIEFAKDLQNKIYDREKTHSEEIIKYLESDATGDNSSFHNVDIHSNYEQVTWGELQVKIETETIPQIKEMSDTIGTIFFDFMVSVTEDGEKRYMNVEEYYYVRYTENRMYLLDYERIANEIFTISKDRFEGNNIYLGVTGEEMEYKENVDGTIVSFVQENTLWQYNNNSDRIIKVFGFYNNDIRDSRDNYDQHQVKIVDMDENGNLQFMVCGYMNRGRHEGETGIAMYYYDSMINCIEEEVFLPSTKPYQLIKEDIGQLICVNRNNEMYIYMDGSMYKIDLNSHTYEVVVSGLNTGNYAVSKDDTMFAWQEELQLYNSKSIQVLSLMDGESYQVQAGENECIVPLGFMERDFIYGIAKQEDVKYDVSGAMRFPMYSVCIRNKKNVEIEYNREGIYIVSATIKDNVIQLERCQRTGDGTYKNIDSDSIMNNDEVEKANVSLNSFATEVKKKQMKLVLAYDISGTKPKLLTPREVVFESTRNVIIEEEQKKETDCYYVYARYGLMGIYTDAGQAIETAKTYSGVVLNEKQNYVWEKTKRQTRARIPQVEAAAEGESTLSVCLTQLLKAGGYTVDAKPLLQQGEPVLSILNKYVEGDVLDLSGLMLEEVLYYVSRGYPVLAVLGENKGVLIVGYDEFNVLIMDPANGGTPYKKGLKDSREYFENYGNNFISFIK